MKRQTDLSTSNPKFPIAFKQGFPFVDLDSKEAIN